MLTVVPEDSDRLVNWHGGEGDGRGEEGGGRANAFTLNQPSSGVLSGSSCLNTASVLNGARKSQAELSAAVQRRCG